MPAFQELMDIRAGEPLPEGEVAIRGADPVFSTTFKAGQTCAAAIAAVGVAVSDLWQMKTGRRQLVGVDVRRAAAALRSAHYLQQADAEGRFAALSNPAYEKHQRITRPWPTRDGRWFLPHFALPNLQERVLKVLDCAFEQDAVARAVGRWDALELENAIDEARGCGAMVRSNAEWLAHPHGAMLARKPVVEVIRIGDSDPEKLPAGERPLAGIRVLDLTRILAGPIAARTLAEHGADVLALTARGLPQTLEHVMDTGHGKRSAYLDLKTAEGRQAALELVRRADVFSQGYRPGAMDRLGFSPAALARIRPGIVYCSISCFGSDGPFSHRAGWEQIGQTVSGICHDGHPQRPRLVPAPICDYTTGYLGAFGIALALARRAREGGSYHVRVSLCQSAMLVYRQGQIPYPGAGLELADVELEAFRMTTETPYGRLRHLAPVLQLSETPPRWSRPTPKLGRDRPEWLPEPGANPL
ncbi:MAG: CoA transferase [Reyranellaceae bacterium]